MARARNADKAAESAQEAREAQGSSSAFQADDRSDSVTTAQGASFGCAERPPRQPAAAQERSDEAELVECVLRECAVTGCEALNLRAEPVLDAPVAAVLPRGAGVFEDGEPGPEGWLHVRTGRLEGWMMSKYLEPLPLPEWPAQATGKLPYGAE